MTDVGITDGDRQTLRSLESICSNEARARELRRLLANASEEGWSALAALGTDPDGNRAYEAIMEKGRQEGLEQAVKAVRKYLDDQDVPYGKALGVPPEVRATCSTLSIVIKIILALSAEHGAAGEESRSCGQRC